MKPLSREDTSSQTSRRFPLQVDRYAIYGEIASGGMASVHFARLSGAHGFSRTVAAKRLLPRLSRDREFSLMLIDEARLAARIHHPNVVSTLDVVQTPDELVLVMDYVHGESVSALVRSSLARGESIPYPIALAIIIDTLHGLHAAHEAKDEHGVPLGIVHRDISPQNLLVATDGVTRIVDFGVAKAAGRLQATADGVVKGKLAYMAPEQIDLGEATRQSDLFATSIVLWELLTGARLFGGTNAGQIMHQVMSAQIPKPSSVAPTVPEALDAILARGLALNPADRYETALDMARALEACAPAIRPAEIGAWVSEVAAEALERRAELRAAVEQHVPEASDSETAPHAFDASGAAAGTPSSSAATPGPARSGSAPRARDAASATRTMALRSSAEAGGATDTSAILAAAPHSPQRGSRWGIVLGTALVVTLVAAWLYTRTQMTEVGRPALASGQAAIAPPTAATVLASAASIASDSAPATASVAPAETASAHKVEASKPHLGAPAPRPVRPHATDCDPPYSIDAAGHHIFKVQCM